VVIINSEAVNRSTFNVTVKMFQMFHECTSWLCSNYNKSKNIVTYLESWLELKFLLENHSVARPSNIKVRNNSRSPKEENKLI